MKPGWLIGRIKRMHKLLMLLTTSLTYCHEGESPLRRLISHPCQLTRNKSIPADSTTPTITENSRLGQRELSADVALFRETGWSKMSTVPLSAATTGGHSDRWCPDRLIGHRREASAIVFASAESAQPSGWVTTPTCKIDGPAFHADTVADLLRSGCCDHEFAALKDSAATNKPVA